MKAIIICCLLILIFLSLIEGMAGTGKPIRTTMQVANLSCFSCLYKIRKKLRGVKGVLALNWDFNRGLIYVVHEPVVTGERLTGLISSIGYPARILSNDQLGKSGSFLNPSGARASLQERDSECFRCCSATASTWKKLFDRLFGQKQ